jgi:hypothetical protein
MPSFFAIADLNSAGFKFFMVACWAFEEKITNAVAAAKNKFFIIKINFCNYYR